MNKPDATLPFAPGVFHGEGYWHDRSGKQGRYSTEMEFRESRADEVEQITKRVFFKDDGSVSYEEFSIVTFTITQSPFLEAAIKHEDIEFRGQGYALESYCHYDIELAVDNYLENTYTIRDNSLEYLGSSTNKGNLTVWKEVLRKV